jgi:hypothetical protein
MPIELQNQLMDHAIVEYDNTERFTARWNKMFELLAVYKDREGRCDVPHLHQEDGPNLGNWLNTQRTNKRKGVLDKDLEDKLTNLDVVWDPLYKKRETVYSLLLQYKEREGQSLEQLSTNAFEAPVLAFVAISYCIFMEPFMEIVELFHHGGVYNIDNLPFALIKIKSSYIS